MFPRPLLMAILNVTPDSFSDGGSYFTLDRALDAAKRALDEGADIIDVGGESTRPGAEPVSAEEELRRVLPVVENLARQDVRVSVDTMKASVARECLKVGAEIINDISSFGDPEMAEVCALAGCTVCLMHMQGTPQTMQTSPQYNDVVGEVKSYLLGKADEAIEAGIAQEKIWLDPGIGFGKSDAHNLALIRHLDELVATDYLVLLGVSRKGFIGRTLGVDGKPVPVDERVEGTLAVHVLAQASGVAILRAHDVQASRRAIDMAYAVLSA